MNESARKDDARPARAPRIALLVLVVVAGIVATLTTTRGSAPDKRSQTGASRERTIGQRGERQDLAAGTGDRTAEVGSPSLVTEHGAVVYFGDVQDDRIVPTRPRDLLESPPSGASASFAVVGASPVVGAPIATAAVGEHLVVASTNQAELVRLDRDLGGLRTLTLKELLGTSSELWFGSVIPVSGERVVVSVGFASTVALIEVDVPKWTVTRHVVFSDRFAAFPRLCRARDRLFLLTTRIVDVVSADLARQASVAVDVATIGIACGQDSAWVVGVSAPRVSEITSEGTTGRTLQWRGQGAGDMYFDHEHGVVYGSDQAEGSVFACTVGGECRTSGRLGKKPTNLVRVGGHLVVTVEQARAVAVLDASTLRLVRSVAFPGVPRTVLGRT